MLLSAVGYIPSASWRAPLHAVGCALLSACFNQIVICMKMAVAAVMCTGGFDGRLHRRQTVVSSCTWDSAAKGSAFGWFML